MVFQNDARVFFVAETKFSTVHGALRPIERLKIACGHKHFLLAQSVTFEVVDSLKTLKQQAGIP